MERTTTPVPSDEMKKVLHVIVGLNAGGAEMLLTELVSNSKDLFYSEVVVLGNYVDLIDRFESDGIKTHQLELDKSVGSLIRGLAELDRIEKQTGFDILHAHMYHGLLLSTLYRMFYKRLDIAFTPNNVSFKSKMRELFVRLTKSQRKADILFGESMLSNIYRDDYRVLTNAIDVDKFSVDAEKYERFTFVHVGRLEPQKNHLEFLDMIKEVSLQRDNFRVCFVGKGELEDDIKSKITDLGLEDVVEMWGYRRDIAEICAKAHAFVMPSLWEGLPVAMLEAGASGLLVCCTPVGSIPDYITDETGILTSLEEFPSQMINIIDNYDYLKVKGDKLREKIRAEFNIRSIALQHQELYEGLGTPQRKAA